MNHFCEKTILQSFQFVAYIKSPRRKLNSGHDGLDFFYPLRSMWLSLFICIHYSTMFVIFLILSLFGYCIFIILRSNLFEERIVLFIHNTKTVCRGANIFTFF